MSIQSLVGWPFHLFCIKTHRPLSARGRRAAPSSGSPPGRTPHCAGPATPRPRPVRGTAVPTFDDFYRDPYYSAYYRGPVRMGQPTPPMPASPPFPGSPGWHGFDDEDDFFDEPDGPDLYVRQALDRL